MEEKINLENLLKAELYKFYSDINRVNEVFLQLKSEEEMKELFEFISKMEIKRVSQIDSKLYLMLGHKSKKEEQLINDLFAIWNNADFVLGCCLLLRTDDEREKVIKYIAENRNLSQKEIIDEVMELALTLKNSRI